MRSISFVLLLVCSLLLLGSAGKEYEIDSTVLLKDVTYTERFAYVKEDRKLVMESSYEIPHTMYSTMPCPPETGTILELTNF